MATTKADVSLDSKTTTARDAKLRVTREAVRTVRVRTHLRTGSHVSSGTTTSIQP